MENVVITGMGITSALGIGVKSNLRFLRDGVTGIGKMEFLAAKHSEYPVGEVKYSDKEMRRNMELADVGSIPRASIFGIAAIREAISSANISQRIAEIKLITGTEAGGTDIIEDTYFDLLATKEIVDDIDHMSIRWPTNLISHYTGINPERTVTVSTACSSALNAIILGTRLVRSGRERLVVAGGCEALTKYLFNGLRSLHITDRRFCKPFDRDSEGINPGEGGAYFVLESETEAKKRGAKILGYITGFCNTSDAFGQVSASPDGEGAFLAMSGALESAGLKPTDIDYINAHGTGVRDNDISESKAIMRLFGEKYPPVSSTKGFTGHTGSASGSIGAVLSVLALRNSFIPQNLGWRNIADGAIIPTKGKKSVRLKHILCNSFGFGGNDSSIVISSEPTGNWKDAGRTETGIATGRELDEEDKLRETDKYVKPQKVHKMGRIMKAAVVSSMELMKECGVERPDAIICCTLNGMLENKEQYLLDLRKNGEDTPKPAMFIQSAYNTLASNLAIITGCHGYNMTYSEKSADMAFQDAEMLIEEGVADIVLIGKHEETTDYFRQVLLKHDEKQHQKPEIRKRISSQSFIVWKK